MSECRKNFIKVGGRGRAAVLCLEMSPPPAYEVGLDHVAKTPARPRSGTKRQDRFLLYGPKRNSCLDDEKKVEQIKLPNIENGGTTGSSCGKNRRTNCRTSRKNVKPTRGKNASPCRGRSKEGAGQKSDLENGTSGFCLHFTYGQAMEELAVECRETARKQFKMCDVRLILHDVDIDDLEKLTQKKTDPRPVEYKDYHYNSSFHCSGQKQGFPSKQRDGLLIETPVSCSAAKFPQLMERIECSSQDGLDGLVDLLRSSDSSIRTTNFGAFSAKSNGLDAPLSPVTKNVKQMRRTRLPAISHRAPYNWKPAEGMSSASKQRRSQPMTRPPTERALAETGGNLDLRDGKSFRANNTGSERKGRGSEKSVLVSTRGWPAEEEGSGNPEVSCSKLEQDSMGAQGGRGKRVRFSLPVVMTRTNEGHPGLNSNSQW